MATENVRFHRPVMGLVGPRANTGCHRAFRQSSLGLPSGSRQQARSRAGSSAFGRAHRLLDLVLGASVPRCGFPLYVTWKRLLARPPDGEEVVISADEDLAVRYRW